MKRLSFVLLALLACPSYATVYDLDVAMDNVRTACSGINSKMDHLKLMAGINTGIGAVGTVTGAVALGTGIAKAQKDAESEKLLEKITKRLEKLDDKYKEFADKNKEVKDNKKLEALFREDVRAKYAQYTKDGKFNEKDAKTGKETDLVKEKAKIDAESKTLGNVRTGMLAANTATSVAGAVISSQNKTTGSIKEAINKCISATEDLRESMMQARMDGRDTVVAKRIVDACSEYKTADLSKINKLATGSTVTSSIGAVAGGVGMITSIAANTDSTRQGSASKENGLNTASNVLSGVTTATSAVSTVLNGVQIATIKKVVSISEKCEKEIQ